MLYDEIEEILVVALCQSASPEIPPGDSQSCSGIAGGAEEGGTWMTTLILGNKLLTPSSSGLKMSFLGEDRSCSLLKAESKPGEHPAVVFIRTNPISLYPESPRGALCLAALLPNGGLYPCKYTEKFIELFAVMKFLLMAANRRKPETIPWLELQSALHEFSRAVKTESTNETVI